MSSFVFAGTIVSNEADWELDDDYLDINLDLNDVCGSIKDFEDDQIYLEETRFYYLFNNETNEKIGTYKLFKDKCVSMDTNETVTFK